MMKLAKVTTVLAAAAAASAAVGIGAPIAVADDQASHTLGSQAELVNGPVIQGWTVSNLTTSSDQIPYPVKGTLWEATATDEALQGTVIPIISNLNARAKSGQTYRVLFHVATPQGVNPATLAQGQKTTGKVYFDVTGDSPDSVVYTAGGQDLLTWVNPPPSTAGTETPSAPYPSRLRLTPAPAATPATPAATASPAPAATQPAPPPAASQIEELPAASLGTPLPAGSQGTPLPAGDQVVPSTTTAEGTPASATPHGPRPASVEGEPLPAGSQGTPLPAGEDVMPTPTTTTLAPTPRGSR